MPQFFSFKVWRDIWARSTARLTWEHAIFAALLMGCLLRLVHFGFGRMLWLDEVMVAINLEVRDGAQLLTPLDFKQVAPAGWLLMVDGFASLFNNYEYGARFPALLAGLGSLLIFYRIARAEFSPPVAFVAVFAFSISYMLVYFSAELKPYAFDLLLWAITASIALRIQRDGQVPTMALGVLILVFVFGGAYSFAAPAVVGGIGGVLILKNVMERKYRIAGLLVAGAVLSAIIYLFLALSIYQQQVELGGLSEGGMGHYFNRLYAPFPPTSLGDLVWYPQFVNDTMGALFGVESAYVFIALAVFGSVALMRKNAWTFAIVIAPIVVSFILSAAKIYPIMPRLVLHFVPIIILLSAYAIEVVYRQAPRLILPIVLGLCLLVSIGSFGWFRYENTFTPWNSDKSLHSELETLAQKVGQDDLVVVSEWSMPGYLFYRHKYGLNDTAWVIVSDLDCLSGLDTVLEDAATIWLVKGRFEEAGLERQLPYQGSLAGTDATWFSIEGLERRLDRLTLVQLDQANRTIKCSDGHRVTPYLFGGRAPLQLD